MNIWMNIDEYINCMGLLKMRLKTIKNVFKVIQRMCVSAIASFLEWLWWGWSVYTWPGTAEHHGSDHSQVATHTHTRTHTHLFSCFRSHSLSLSISSSFTGSSATSRCPPVALSAGAWLAAAPTRRSGWWRASGGGWWLTCVLTTKGRTPTGLVSTSPTHITCASPALSLR